MQYVVIFPRVVNYGSKILLVEKDRPDWQKGRLNLVGGKIEKGETPEQAALRELQEESGLLPIQVNKITPNENNPRKSEISSVAIKPTVMGQIVGSWGIVYCVKVPILFGQEIHPAKGETEEVAWHDWIKVKTDERLLPSLKIVIPLMSMGVINWVISDEGLKGSLMVTI